MKHGTLRDSLEIELPKYIGRWKSSLTIHPRQEPWLFINGTLVWPNTVDGVKHWSTARFLQIMTKQKKIKVVEHLLSALRAAGITQADIRTETWYIPVIGPWIEPLFSRLNDVWIEMWSELNVKSIDSRVELDFEGAKMIVEPSKTLDFEISTNHPDLADLDSHILREVDITASLINHLLARPIARLQDPKINWLHKILSLNPIYPLNGIWWDSYIMTGIWEWADEIIDRMHTQYQEGRNEHLYHTMVADFLWELALFFPEDLRAKITLIDTNHVTRMELLRMLYRSIN